MDADQALFEGQISSLVALIHSDQKPLSGLAGLLDWRFQGAISRFIRAGFLQGEAGECAYLPLARAGRTYHVILAGAGPARSATPRASAVPAETLKALKKNLASLKLDRVGFSASDLGGVAEDYFAKNLKGIPVCVLR